MSIQTDLEALAKRWLTAAPAERSNAQSYVIELCHALEVECPRPAGLGYEFEAPVKMVGKDGSETPNFIDLYKAGYFVLEAKDQEKDTPDSTLLKKAFGQALTYAAYVPGDHPPYLMVLDVGATLLVWNRWTGSYGGFNAAQRISLPTLHERPDDFELLQDIFERPWVRNPEKRAAAVTREIAGKLALLASSLEARGHDPEEVASFLIRCVFTMFAEDIELIPEGTFEETLETGLKAPELMEKVFVSLWEAMDSGDFFGPRKFLRFNGHFFKDAKALPLTREDLAVLLEASKADWAKVEPSIMGTLLVRALDPVERHRLGAQFTPSEYVQRLVKPTVEEPIRGRWTRVQAEVFQLLGSNGKGTRKQKSDEKEALKRLREFHGWLRGLRFLDPACGSGNFLYATLKLVKQIEAEVLRSIEEIEGQPGIHLEEVGPWQFHGIEIKQWAREIAELTLWIGHFQIWRELHGRTQPPEPVLRDEGNLECRDAVLAWDEIREDPTRSRADPTPRIPHSVTGELVPDPEATLPYQEYLGARPTEWPSVDFIVGNPPYMGISRQREAFGDGYVEALRREYPELPDSVDFVMYWWWKSALAVGSGRTIHAGLITTNSITQPRSRVAIEKAASLGVHVTWGIPDHPWVDEVGAADVRVAMTVTSVSPGPARLLLISPSGQELRSVLVPRLNPDLTAHANIPEAAALPLLANKSLSHVGFEPTGMGFVLKPSEAERLFDGDPALAEVVKPYANGRDLTSRPRGAYIIDFGTMSVEEAAAHPVPFDIVRTRVKPFRDSNNDTRRREVWWQFGRNNEALRETLEELPRFFVTVKTAKHRVFLSLPRSMVPDSKLICVTASEWWILGVLSSSIHTAWASAAGGLLEDRPSYVKSKCFDPFPFPDPPGGILPEISEKANALDGLRWKAVGTAGRVSLTAVYNVLAKLRSGEPLTPSERKVHELAACGVLLDLHNELDALVAEAYGWPWPMESDETLSRLVELHDERVAEEKAGKVRWLRPEYQIPRFGKDIKGEAPVLEIEDHVEKVAEEEVPWPSKTIEQIAAIQELLSKHPSSIDEATKAFKGGRKDQVERHLETLAIYGEAWVDGSGVYHALGGS